MSLDSRYEGIRELMRLGQQRGYLYYDEIGEALPGQVCTSGELDEIFDFLGSAGIDVVDPDQEEPGGIVREAAGGDGPELRVDARRGAPDACVDPERRYFRDMAPLRLLTREGEIAIARRMEHGREAVLDALSESPLAVREILDLGRRLRNGEMAIGDLVSMDEDEPGEAVLAERTASVLRAMESIRRHERTALRIRQKIGVCRGDSRLARKHRGLLERHCIAVATRVRALGLRSVHRDRLVGVIRNVVRRAVACERAIRVLETGRTNSRSPEDARSVRSEIRKLRAEIAMTAYTRSALLKYLEEALAQGYGVLRSHGLAQAVEALRFPLTHGYVTISQIAAEGQTLGTITLGGVLFRVSIAQGSIPEQPE